jgi:type II secretory pathway component PulF
MDKINQKKRKFLLSIFTADLLRGFPRFTTARHRKESVGLLMKEMAVCVRREFPLPEALDQIARGGTRLKRIYPVGKYLIYFILLTILLSVVFQKLLSMGFGWTGHLSNICSFLSSNAFTLIWINHMGFQENYLKHLARKLSLKLNNGMPLSRAMETMPGAFLPHETALIKTGEKTGKLEEAMENVSYYNTLTDKIPQTQYLAYYLISSIIFYFVLLSLVNSFIFPRFEDIFAQLGVNMPWQSRLIFDTFDNMLNSPPGFIIFYSAIILCVYLLTYNTVEMFFVTDWIPGTIIIALLLSMVFGLFITGILNSIMNHNISGLSRILGLLSIPLFILIGIYVGVKKIRGNRCSWLEYIFNSIPVIKKILSPVYNSRFLYTLSALIQSGVPLHEAIEYAGEVSGSKNSQVESWKISSGLQQGKSFNKALSTSKILTPSLRRRIGLAESSGRLFEVCRDLSEELLEGFTIRAEKAKISLRILLTFIMGLFTFALLIGLYTPYFMIPGVVINYSD